MTLTRSTRCVWPCWPRTAALLPLLAAGLLAGGVSHAANNADATDAADEAKPAASRAARSAKSASALKLGLDPVQFELAHLSKHPVVNQTAALRTQWYATAKLMPSLEWRASLRLDADSQTGGSARFDDTQASLGDTYLRWRGGDSRITAGLQTVVWGRVDGVSLLDRVSRVDLRRFALDDLKDRRLPQPALRWEQEWGDFKSDLVWLAGHREVLLPDGRSVWHPVNRQASQVLGIQAQPALAPFFAVAPLDAANHASGGTALRVTYIGAPFDYGVTLGRVRQPLPYLQFDVPAGRIRSLQPMNSFVSADFEVSGDAATWRGELAYTRDVPMTSLGGQQLKASSVDLAGGVEFFPGGRDTRVTLQMLLRSVRVGQATFELQRYAALNGEVETSFDQGRWKAGLRFAAGLNISDNYLSPRISFVGWEPHEIYLAAHLFSGAPQGYGGFMRLNNALAVGVKTRF